MHAFILAGGFATRLWPLTEKRAKPLLPLAGLPILTHIVEKIPAEIAVTVSTNAVFEESFHTWAKTIDRASLDIMIEPTTHDDKKLGTNGALAEWIRSARIEEDILLLTGDNYLGFSIEEFLKHYSGNTLIAAFDSGNLDEAKKFGTVMLDDDGKRIAGFEEKPAAPKTTLVSTGCSVIPASTFTVIVEYAKTHPDHIGGIFEEFLRRGIAIDCFRFEEPWFDVGSFETYLTATKALVGDRALLASTAQLQTCETEGSVVVGERSVVEGSTLRDSVIFEGCRIRNCVLERCVIDDGCTLEGVDLTGKMIRAGTVLNASA